jgi:hypothetical protein
LTLVALMAVAILGSNAGHGQVSRLVERAQGQTPQALIQRYLTKVAEGDRQAALALWSPEGTPNTALEARRESVTDTLLTSGPSLAHRILDTEWWRTCCEPGVIDDPNEAGGARIRVTISGRDLPETIYVFDLLVPGGYWGAAAGYPSRQWAIIDVYPEGAAPLAWTRS